jgi:hypothetical protein
MPSLNILKGTSRNVELFTNYVIKKPIYHDKEESNIIRLINIGYEGEFETLKEILFWNYIKDDKLSKSAFSSIVEYNIEDCTIKAEKLNSIDEESFVYFINFYYDLFEYNEDIRIYIDNHGFDSYKNYGIDTKGNLRMLDYAFSSDYILCYSGIKLDNKSNSISAEDQVKTLKDTIKYFISNIDKNEKDKINFHLKSFALTLKYHKSIPKLMFFLWKNKIKSIKEIFIFLRTYKKS